MILISIILTLTILIIAGQALATKIKQMQLAKRIDKRNAERDNTIAILRNNRRVKY